MFQTLDQTAGQYSLSAGKFKGQEGPENCQNPKEMRISEEASSLKSLLKRHSKSQTEKGDLVLLMSNYRRRGSHAPECKAPDNVGAAQLMAWLRSSPGSSRWNWE